MVASSEETTNSGCDDVGSTGSGCTTTAYSRPTFTFTSGPSPPFASPSRDKKTTNYTTTFAATSPRKNNKWSVFASVTGATERSGYGYTTFPPHRPVILTVVLPLLSVIFVLLMFICFILIWKKTLKRKKSKRDSLKLQNNESKQELGEVKGKFKDPYPIEQSVTSLNHYTDSKSDGYKKGLATKDSANGEAQYAEVEECTQPVKEGRTQENHGYEEAIVGGTQRNDGYEEAKVESTRNGQGYEKAKDKGTQDKDGYETAKVSGPFYHTLDTDDPTDSSYMSVSKNKQDGGYDTLDRQQKPSQTKSQTDSGYDLTERIGKGDAKVEPKQIDNDYLAVNRSSANTSEYDKLDRTRRNYEVDGISPNEYNALQPQEKE